MKTIIAVTVSAGLAFAGYQAIANDDSVASPSTSISGAPSTEVVQPSESSSPDSQTSATADASNSTGETGVAQVATITELKDLLVYLVQEEKLAHDLYVELADSSGIRKFSNILQSETQHVSAIQTLLSTYGITDPTVGLDPGEFVNQELQDLYDSLLASGTASSAGAIAAGVAVEETDIADIERMLDNDLPVDVEAVLNQLLSASYKHLSAFNR